MKTLDIIKQQIKANTLGAVISYHEWNTGRKIMAMQLQSMLSDYFTFLEDVNDGDIDNLEILTNVIIPCMADGEIIKYSTEYGDVVVYLIEDKDKVKINNIEFKEKERV